VALTEDIVRLPSVKLKLVGVDMNPLKLLRIADDMVNEPEMPQSGGQVRPLKVVYGLPV